jgi:hypothetical protein
MVLVWPPEVVVVLAVPCDEEAAVDTELEVSDVLGTPLLVVVMLPLLAVVELDVPGLDVVLLVKKLLTLAVLVLPAEVTLVALLVVVFDEAVLVVTALVVLTTLLVEVVTMLLLLSEETEEEVDNDDVVETGAELVETEVDEAMVDDWLVEVGINEELEVVGSPDGEQIPMIESILSTPASMATSSVPQSSLLAM